MISLDESPTRVILCIDDDEAILQWERFLFEKSGYAILTATSGQEGLRLAKLRGLDLVVLDYCMPGMNGHEVASVMKRIRSDVKIVLLSGSDVPADALASVDAFVEKPEAHKQLLPIVNALLSPRDWRVFAK